MPPIMIIINQVVFDHCFWTIVRLFLSTRPQPGQLNALVEISRLQSGQLNKFGFIFVY
jgi:hypothetical protein